MFQHLRDFLALLNCPTTVALVSDLEAAGADVYQVAQAILNHSGISTINAALKKLLDDLAA